ncbi:MAG: hypothetical protein DHS20C11_07800 [Lysobacteraceae bacterium]|nr:MAG: hypothetical protein DHS20C11_07800 [Xanthomonadaceae bacterium]
MLLLGSSDIAALRGLLNRYGLGLQQVAPKQSIPGSHWGDEEAGLIDDQLFARADTPIHSVLHEGCHYVCMDANRRSALDTDAGGDYDEENAVCYLQILLADHLPGYDRMTTMSEMDQWGYSFRLGSARSWFEHDAADAFDWLRSHQLITASGEVTFQLRQ